MSLSRMGLIKILGGVLAVSMALVASTASAVPLFPQCPPTGVNTGCQFLITINPGGSLSVTQDTTAPNNGPYDSLEDTLVGVVNNSGGPVSSFALTSTVDIFGFDGDGPCTGSGFSPAATGCSTDPSGYGGPGVFFSGINGAATSGTVGFSPSLANGDTTWFALEGALDITQIVQLPPAIAAPALSEWAMIWLGAAFALLGGFILSRRRRS
ncbi:MAG: LPXTG cell wall anchor domain-containing protein [Rudaea sp.]